MVGAKLYETVLTKCVERILIQVTLYDSSGNIATLNTTPYRTDLSITLHVASKSTTEDYDDASPWGSGEKQEVSLFGNVLSTEKTTKTIIIHKEDFSNLSKILLDILTERMTTLTFSVKCNGIFNTNVSISEEVITRCFSLYSQVYFDFAKSDVFYVEWPRNGEFECDIFSLKNAVIRMNGNSQIKSHSPCEMNTVTFKRGKCDEYGSQFLISCDKVTLYNINVTYPMSLNCGTGTKETLDEYKLTQFTATQIKYDLTEFSKPNSNNSIWEDALLRIEGFSSVSLNSFDFYGGDWLKGVRISKCAKANISSFNRLSSAEGTINAYSLGIGSTAETCISGFNVKTATTPTNINTAFAIFLETTTLENTSKISVSSFNVSNVLLYNANGLKSYRVEFKSGTFVGASFCESGNNDINRLYYNDCNITVRDGFHMYARSISLTDTVVNVENGPAEFESDGPIRLKQTRMSTQLNDVNFTVIGAGSVYTDRLDLLCGNLSFNGEDYGDETLDENVQKTDRTITIKDSSLHVRKDLTVIDVVGGVYLENSGIHKMKSATFKNLYNLKGENVVFFTEGTPFKMTIDDTYISSSEINIDDEDVQVANKSIVINKCEIRNFDIILSNENKNNSVLDVDVSESNINLSLGTTGGEALVRFKAKNSLGSIIWGTSSDVTFAPNLQGLTTEDISVIKETQTKQQDQSVFYYGVASSS